MSDFDGATWSAPVAIPGTDGFNSQVTAATDSAGNDGGSTNQIIILASDNGLPSASSLRTNTIIVVKATSHPGQSYLLETTTNLAEGIPWEFLTNVNLTNIVQPVEGRTNSTGQMFYRAR